MTRCSIEPKTRNFVKGYRFLSFVRNSTYKFGKQLLDPATKTGINVLKTASNLVNH